LDCTSDSARLADEAPDSRATLIEVRGDPRRLIAILEGKKDPQREFLAGGIQVRGNLEYLCDLLLELGIITKPM
jgi:hypothetical protein